MCRTIDYKKITASLSHKVERLQQGGEMDGEGEEEEEGGNVLGGALERVRELELELAQTKLALVETECKNQDLTHQFTAANNQVTLHTRRVGCGQGGSSLILHYYFSQLHHFLFIVFQPLHFAGNPVLRSAIKHLVHKNTLLYKRGGGGQNYQQNSRKYEKIQFRANDRKRR